MKALAVITRKPRSLKSSPPRPFFVAGGLDARMRLIMWILTIAFALAGLALRADVTWFGPSLAYLSDTFVKGFFVLAGLCCPFLWARSYGFIPRALQISGKERFMLGLAMILAIPLILPWH